jgi:hypothetical protein
MFAVGPRFVTTNDSAAPRGVPTSGTDSRPDENPRYGSRRVAASAGVHCGPGSIYPSPGTPLNWLLLALFRLPSTRRGSSLYTESAVGNDTEPAGTPTTLTVSEAVHLRHFGHRPGSRITGPARVRSPARARAHRRQGVGAEKTPHMPGSTGDRTPRCCRHACRSEPSGRRRRCWAREPSSRRLRTTRRGGRRRRRRRGRRCATAPW